MNTHPLGQIHHISLILSGAGGRFQGNTTVFAAVHFVGTGHRIGATLRAVNYWCHVANAVSDYATVQGGHQLRYLQIKAIPLGYPVQRLPL